MTTDTARCDVCGKSSDDATTARKAGRERGNYYCRLISLFYLTLVSQGYANIFVNRGTHVQGENDDDMHHERFSRRVKAD